MRSTCVCFISVSLGASSPLQIMGVDISVSLFSLSRCMVPAHSPDHPGLSSEVHLFLGPASISSPHLSIFPSTVLGHFLSSLTWIIQVSTGSPHNPVSLCSRPRSFLSELYFLWCMSCHVTFCLKLSRVFNRVTSSPQRGQKRVLERQKFLGNITVCSPPEGCYGI